MARSLTLNSSPVVLAVVMYIVLLWPLVRLVGRLENNGERVSEALTNRSSPLTD